MTVSAATLSLAGCATDVVYESVDLDAIEGMTMEEVIALEGEPDARSESQLIYTYNKRSEVNPIWAYVLLYGLAGGGGSADPDLTYVDKDHYCLTLDFEDDVLVGYDLGTRDEEESSGLPENLDS